VAPDYTEQSDSAGALVTAATEYARTLAPKQPKQPGGRVHR
jgi:hypothetical protein